MAKTGSPPRWLKHVNKVVILMNRRAWPVRIPRGAKVMLDAGVVPDVTPESFAALAGRCAVFRIEVA